jgi:hypothetical protein
MGKFLPLLIGRCMVNKFTLMPLLVLPACGLPGENARLTQEALAHD